MIIAEAPCRISLYGGGTDLEPFASQYGGEVINMAINLKQKAFLDEGEEREQHQLIDRIALLYPKREFSFRTEPKQGKLMGLGSSASYCVAAIGALNQFHGLSNSRQDIAEMAWSVETSLGWVTGRQDQYAVAFGGFNYWRFGKRISCQPLNEGRLLDWCLLLNIGGERHSGDLQAKLRERMVKSQASDPLKKTLKITRRGLEAIKAEDYEKVGRLLNRAWELKKSANPACSNERIDKMYAAAIKAGALGGKVLGAGGAGHMFFIVDQAKRTKVAKTLGLEPIPFKIDYQGLVVKEK